jgi:cytochrome c-type biogenesis protein CcmH
MTRRLPLVLAIVLLSASSSTGQSQESAALGVDNRAVLGEPLGSQVSGPELVERTEDLTSIMRCPVCQGLSIADSDTMIAMAMKEEVRQFIAAGYTDEQNLLYFEASYGEFIRLEPKPTGFNLTVWIAPVAALLIGLFLLVLRFRGTPALAQPDRETGGDDEELAAYRDRVRKEISP